MFGVEVFHGDQTAHLYCIRRRGHAELEFVDDVSVRPQYTLISKQDTRSDSPERMRVGFQRNAKSPPRREPLRLSQTWQHRRIVELITWAMEDSC